MKSKYLDISASGCLMFLSKGGLKNTHIFFSLYFLKLFTIGISKKTSFVLGRNRPNITKYALKRPQLPFKRPKTYKHPYLHCLTPAFTLNHILTFYYNIIRK